MKAVLDLSKLNQGSSGHGWHWNLNWLGCQKRAHLLDTLPRARIAEVTPRYFLVGSVLHKLLELHESSTGYQDITFKNVPPHLAAPVDEAWEIFRHYRAYYPPGWWGAVKARELSLIDDDGYTGRLDLVLRILNKTHIQHWYEVGVTVGHGTYIGDYKSFTPPFDPLDYWDNPQFTGYDHLYRQKYYRQADGTLILGINKVDRKNPPVRGLLIPPAGARQYRIWKVQLNLAYARRTSALRDLPNVAHCGYGQYRCPFYMKECRLLSQ